MRARSASIQRRSIDPSAEPGREIDAIGDECAAVRLRVSMFVHERAIRATTLLVGKDTGGSPLRHFASPLHRQCAPAHCVLDLGSDLHLDRWRRAADDEPEPGWGHRVEILRIREVLEDTNPVCREPNARFERSHHPRIRGSSRKGWVLSCGLREKAGAFLGGLFWRAARVLSAWGTKG